MPDNYILLFNLLPPAERINQLLRDAKPQIERINSAIAKRETVRPKTSFMAWIKTAVSYPIYKYDRSTKPCGMITMNEHKPVWQEGKCTQCLSCLHRCPKHAIQYGNKTLNRGRYVNPNLKGQNMPQIRQLPLESPDMFV